MGDTNDVTQGSRDLDLIMLIKRKCKRVIEMTSRKISTCFFSHALFEMFQKHPYKHALVACASLLLTSGSAFYFIHLGTPLSVHSGGLVYKTWKK